MQHDPDQLISRLRVELARRELEKSGIVASIGSPATSAVQIQKAMTRYVDLDGEIRMIINELQTVTAQVSELSRPEPPTLQHHRLNSDGTFDSICVRCFATIGNSRREEDLKAAERVHVCDPESLWRFH